MTPEELKQVEELIKKHQRSSPIAGDIVLFLFLLFLNGCFKGCGY